MVVFDGLLAIVSRDETWFLEEPSSLAHDIARRRPREAWLIVARRLEDVGTKSFWLRTWLQGRATLGEEPESSPISAFPPDMVIEWIMGDRPNRASSVLNCLPYSLAVGKGDLTKLYIEHVVAGDDDADGVMWRLSHGSGFVGKQSDALRRRRDAARSWLAEGQSAKVTRWLTRYLSRLNSEIEGAEMSEERRGY